MSNAPIGMFDSGLGGLSVMHAVRGALPGEDTFITVIVSTHRTATETPST